MKRGYLQISFAWIFAIIVGIVILFLAIYLSTRLISTEQTSQDAKTGKEIEIILNPLETGFESAKSTSMTLPVETRIYNKCRTTGNFGMQIIQISQKSLSKWTDTDLDVGFQNKYIFSEDFAEGKKFYIFSKPLDMPYKIADVIVLVSASKRYCFSNAPQDVLEETEFLNQGNLEFGDCSDDATKICFGAGSKCDISVNVGAEFVEKSGGRVYFSGKALMLAAIFSEKEVYECQLKRLMMRMKILSGIYSDKANLVSAKGCNSNLNAELSLLSGLADTFKSSGDLETISNFAEDMENKNSRAVCKLW